MKCEEAHLSGSGCLPICDQKRVTLEERLMKIEARTSSEAVIKGGWNPENSLTPADFEEHACLPMADLNWLIGQVRKEREKRVEERVKRVLDVAWIKISPGDTITADSIRLLKDAVRQEIEEEDSQ